MSADPITLGESQGQSTLQAALSLAEEYGLPVLPCRRIDEVIDGRRYRAKSPLTPHGYKNASTSIDQIVEWWTQRPDALIGVPTGAASNLFCIDVDPPGADWYANNFNRLNAGRIHTTPRGHHLLYRASGLGCTTRTLADGVDTRGEGGHIIFWPAHGLEAVGDIEDVGPLPAWVTDELKAAYARKTEQTPSDGGVGTDRSRDLLARVGRDVRAGLANYEIIAKHRAHPHAVDQTDADRAVQRCIDKAREDAAGIDADDQYEWVPPPVVTYGEHFDPAAIPLREWLIRGRYALGEGTAIAGPPGTNKSSLLLTDAVQLVTQRSLLGEAIDKGGGVLFLVGEDRRRDFDARLAGLCEHYRIPPLELGNRLHVVYQSEINPAEYTLARMVEDMATLNMQMFDWLGQFPSLVALFIDPMVSWHRLIENDNMAMQQLCIALRGLAAQANIAVAFDHHVTKVAMFDPEAHVGNLAAMRGGSTIAADMRWAFTMARLKPETAAQFGIAEEDRKVYRRLDTLKASYGPDDEGPRLLKIESVRIAPMDKSAENRRNRTVADSWAMPSRGCCARSVPDRPPRRRFGSRPARPNYLHPREARCVTALYAIGCLPRLAKASTR
jgi:RecA-family ATPase